MAEKHPVLFEHFVNICLTLIVLLRQKDILHIFFDLIHLGLTNLLDALASLGLIIVTHSLTHTLTHSLTHSQTEWKHTVSQILQIP